MGCVGCLGLMVLSYLMWMVNCKYFWEINVNVVWFGCLLLGYCE